MNLQYAFYFLVVGAAIWASSWAGESKLFLRISMELVLVVQLIELELGFQRYHVGCGPESGNPPR